MNSNKNADVATVKEIIDSYTDNLDRILAIVNPTSKPAAIANFFWSQLDLVLRASGLDKQDLTIEYYEQWCADWDCYSIDPVCLLVGENSNTELLSSFLQSTLEKYLFQQAEFNDADIVLLRFTLDVNAKTLIQVSVANGLDEGDFNPIAALLINLPIDPTKSDTFTAQLKLLDYDLSAAGSIELIKQQVTKVYPNCITRLVYYEEQRYGCWIPELKNLDLSLPKCRPEKLIKERFDHLTAYQVQRKIF